MERITEGSTMPPGGTAAENSTASPLLKLPAGQEQPGPPSLESIRQNLKGSHRPRSRSRTDSFQRWQKQQAQEIRASNSCHLLIMNLHRGSHNLASAKIEQEAGPAVMRIIMIEDKTFGFATMASAALAEEFAKKLNGLELDNGVTLAVERCKAVTPQRNPRVYDASTPVSVHVAVKNLPYNCSEQGLRSLLDTAAIDQPLSIDLKMNAQGQFNGTAFLEFANVEVSELACHLISAIAMEGRVLRAEFKRPVGNAPKVYRPPDDDCQRLYDELIEFKESRRVEVVYPNSISAVERKQLHLMAESLHLKHVSIGKGPDSTLRIWKGSKSMSPGPRRSSLGSMAHSARHSSLDKAKAAALRAPRSRSLGAKTGPNANKARLEVRSQMLANNGSRKPTCILREPKGPGGVAFATRNHRTRVTDV
eukprot:TRINITY_DN8359_c0_g1_i3.p1 TRINITY_DN8359_c0_g1~~TRINITY_DN8359_c0_g1_i3.p1  ORF type:complete len:421 (+),score=79.69 TRINITY_DN8359_c0_g1_i3:162-1424(+)